MTWLLRKDGLQLEGYLGDARRATISMAGWRATAGGDRSTFQLYAVYFSMVVREDAVPLRGLGSDVGA
jgi:hypothetical protein